MMPDSQPPAPEEALEPGAVLDLDDATTVVSTRPLPLDPLQGDDTPIDQLPTLGHVGRYALKRLIGQGGLGMVHLAHDPLLSRLIAIKTLQVDLPQAEREQFNALFTNEARAAGSLSHPYIVTVYDAGAGVNGAYIAMELLRGKDLRQLLAMGWRPTMQQAALIVRRVADAISYAHHKGVIHRDLKPANIFMVGRTQPRVLDFGIARIRQAGQEGPNDGLSRFGEVVGGSPFYMAPEQIRHEPVDRRADVYALGVILYELLTGRRAFGGASVDEIHQAVLTAQVRPPHEVNRTVPQALSEIVMRAMAPELVRRTRSARTLAQELRDWLDSQRGPGEPAAASSAPERASGSNASASSGGRSDLRGQPADAQPRWHARWALGLVAIAGLVSAGFLLTGAWLAWQRAQAPDAVAVVAAPVVVPAVVPVTAPVPSSVASALPTAPVPDAAASAAAASVAPAVATAVTSAVTSAPPAAVAAPPPAPGWVRLAISPWGQVSVNGRPAGVTPPLTQLKLPPGRHVVTVRNDGAEPHTVTVQVKSGQTQVVRHAF
jgi:eukaryotic-like serine/threonine-protein kinase